MYILNTKILDNDYTNLNVSVELVNLNQYGEYGLDDSFYGGRVQCIGKIKNSPVLLLINNQIDGLQVVDTAIEKLESLNIMVLKKLAKDKGIKFDYRQSTKEEVVELLKEKLHKVNKAA